MKTHETRMPLFAHHPHPTPGWLTAHPLKRGALLSWAALLTASAATIHVIGVLKQPPQLALLTTLLLICAILQAALAVAVVATPVRRLLIVAAVIQGAALLFWVLVRTIGVPIGSPSSLTSWRPETLGFQDGFLPLTEGVTALFFLSLAARTWTTRSSAWHTIWGFLLVLILLLILLALVVLFAVNSYAAELVFATFFASAGLPESLLSLFLPAVGLLILVLLLRALVPCLRAMMPRAGRTILVLVPALLVVSLLLWEGGSTAAIRGWFPVSSVINAPAGQTTTLAYCSPGGNPLAMDLSEPLTKALRPAPVVFYVHGGAGFLNSRDLPTDYDGVYFMQLRDELLQRGFVVGSIDYPLIPLASGQEMVNDAKCAVRFLRAHASVLGINPQRIGVYGDSEGGYIASMLGTTGTNPSFDGGQYSNQSSQVQAVGDLWGFTDLTNFSGSPSWVHPFGEGEPVAQQRANSPVTYVAPGDPPFLIIHGTDDGLIALHHSLELAKLLHAANVPTQLVLVQHGEHGFAASAAGAMQQPGPEALVHLISDFFVRTLAI